MRVVSVKGFDGKLEVTDAGDVYSLNYRRTGKRSKLKQTVGADGYPRISVLANRIKKTLLVHRLVGEAFVENPLKKKYINHINSKRSDNRAENLEWCTNSENMIHSKLFNNRIWASGKDRTSSTKIGQFDKSGKLIAEYYGASEAERKTGLDSSSILKATKGIYNYVGGFKWKKL